MKGAYYNEFDPYAAQWLRNLISAGHIAPGDVDERSIVDVSPDDLTGYTQCHFFAGIGGWSLAARMAGWPDDRELWTGSCPCQPFSRAGAKRGESDERHLWPYFRALIDSRKPSAVMGEQVAAKAGRDWFDRVRSDLEDCGYEVGVAIIPACSVDAPHRRDRLWFVAHSDLGKPTQEGEYAEKECGVSQEECESEHGASLSVRGGQTSVNNLAAPWSGATRRLERDQKHRRIEPSIREVANGVPDRMAKLRAYGNAIVPQVAAEVIGAYMDLLL